MVPRAATPESAKEAVPWERAGRLTDWKESHGRGEQNVPTVVQSADADDDRAMLGKGSTKALQVVGHRQETFAA